MFNWKIREAWRNPAVRFVLGLLALYIFIKLVFCFYNFSIFGGWSVFSQARPIELLKWSLIYLVFCVSLINFPFFLIFSFYSLRNTRRLLVLAAILLMAALNTLSVALSILDLFYYRYHLQRADADLLYVLNNPFRAGNRYWLIVFSFALLFCLLLGSLLFYRIRRMINTAGNGKMLQRIAVVLGLYVLLFLFTGKDKLIPTYPLIRIGYQALPLVQNSFHCFAYSLYREKEIVVPRRKYMTEERRKSLFNIYKQNAGSVGQGRNIVLFIMESVPYDFFDSSGMYRVPMPFLDSLLRISTFYTNAFSFSFNSNKAITAILAGIPTATDIPLYHSGFTGLSHSPVGSILEKEGYQSSFFIGDGYDNFGFAKCCQWLGIGRYYCIDDIPGHQKMEHHSMGLQDGYVLSFMQDKLDQTKTPFLAVNYSISTHYPYDLPPSFSTGHVFKGLTRPMRSMQYYDHCLEEFFRKATTASWYKNSVFLFCSDHWAEPDESGVKVDEVRSFHIPIIIFDPSNPQRRVIQEPVSQLDVLNTLFYFAGYKGPFVSYGTSLESPALDPGRVVFTRLNKAVYEAINSRYVLGYDAVAGRPLYAYRYREDEERKRNLISTTAGPGPDSLVLKMQAFLQTLSGHYRHE